MRSARTRASGPGHGVTSAPSPGGDVLVVLPCLNEARTLPGLLSTLLSADAADGILIVVVDGGSTDGTREVAQAAAERDPRIVLLPNPRRLQSAGVNLAANRLGDGRHWLVRIDAHADYPPNYVSSLVKTAQRVGAEAVVVSMKAEGQGCFQRAAAAAQNSRLGTGGAAHRRLAGSGWIDHGHHALFSMKSFLSTGGYDETFAANEDAEFDARLTQSGGRIWLSDELVVLYHPRRGPGALFGQYFGHGAGRARTLLRHRARPRLRQLLPAAVAPAILLLIPGLFVPALMAPAVLWAAACLGYGAWLGLNAGDPCSVMAGAAAMTMHFAWSLGFWSQLVRGPKAAFSPVLSTVAEGPKTGSTADSGSD
jgi:succinoglycan biosynthesis protein ExoA